MASGLPLTALSPLLALQYGIGRRHARGDGRALALGTPVLSLLGAACTALTAPARGGGSVLAASRCPLFVPLSSSVRARPRRRPRGSLAPHLSLVRGSSWRPLRCPAPFARRSASRSTEMNLFYFSSPSTFSTALAAAGALAFVARRGLGAAGLYVALVVAPTDAQQGEVYRIIFIQYAAWMSMFLYFVMACCNKFRSLSTRGLRGDDAAIAPTGDVHLRRCGPEAPIGSARPGEPTGSGTRGSRPSCFPPLPVLRLSRACQRLRGSRRGTQPSRGRLRPHRAGEPADHLFLGELVNTLHQGSSVASRGTSMHVAMFRGMMLMLSRSGLCDQATLARVARIIILERERHARRCDRYRATEFYVWIPTQHDRGRDRLRDRMAARAPSAGAAPSRREILKPQD